MRILQMILIFVFFLSSALFCKRRVSVEEKIGQMIMVGFKGESISCNLILRNQIRSGVIGGIVIFARNIRSPEQLKTFTNEIKQCGAKHPPFIAVDQEGGNVLRLSKKNGFVDFPSAQDVANTKSVKQAYEMYRHMANILLEAGINVNFAPVCDLNVNPDSPVMGKRKRCFSFDPFIVMQYADAFICAHHDQQVATAIKHYPGHGSALGDTHDGIVDITCSWNEEEIIPFASLIKKDNVDMIIVGHVIDRNVDVKYPASLSKNHIQKNLREKLGYNGVVVTDCLQMKAIWSKYRLEGAIVQAINAGCDIVLCSHCYNEKNIYKIKDIIRNAVHQGRIKIGRINEAYKRIMKLKEKYLFLNRT